MPKYHYFLHLKSCVENMGGIQWPQSPQPRLAVKAHLTCDQSSPPSQTLLATSHSALLFMYVTSVLTKEQWNSQNCFPQHYTTCGPVAIVCEGLFKGNLCQKVNLWSSTVFDPWLFAQPCWLTSAFLSHRVSRHTLLKILSGKQQSDTLL